MILRKGRAIEWAIYRRDDSGGYEAWEFGTERDMRRVFKVAYNNGHADACNEEGDFVLLRLTYERIVPDSTGSDGR